MSLHSRGDILFDVIFFKRLRLMDRSFSHYGIAARCCTRSDVK